MGLTAERTTKYLVTTEGSSITQSSRMFRVSLIARAKHGDQEALGEFFDHYADRLFAVVHRFVGGREEAQDLTQEIFLKVRRNIGRLDISRDPAPWLFTVALNTCRDHVRSAATRARHRSVPLDHETVKSQLSDGAADP